MSHPLQPFGFTIALPDLDPLKAALEFVLGADLKPTHRLEIFARLSGYKSYAALKTELGYLDLSGRPVAVPIKAEPVKGDSFMASLPLEVRRRLARQDRIGLLKMIAVALELGRSEIFGETGFVEEDMRFIEARAGKITLTVPKEVVISGTLPAGRLLLVASSGNLENLRAGSDWVAGKGEEPMTLGDRLPRGDGSWHLAQVFLDIDARFFEAPRDEDVVTVAEWTADVLAQLADMLRDVTFVFFDEISMHAFRKAVFASTGRVVSLADCRILSAELCDIEDSAKADFFDIGYYGTARNDVPQERADVSGAFTAQWLAELGNIVHGYHFELKQLGL